MRLRRSVLILAVLFSMLGAQTKKSSSPPLLDVRQMMTAAEFNRAGLQKLAPEEVEALNDWLYRYSLKLLVNVSEPTPSGNAIESYIDGDFEGWSGDTVFKLDNGEIWQQASYAYTYHYAYHPKVLIYKDGSRFKMKVDGVSSTIEVKKLK